MLFPGVVVAILVAVSAQFLAEHYATPAMLMALLLGIAVSFLSEEGRAVEGDLPTVQDGLRGIEFVDACVRSSTRNAAWVKMPE